MNINQRNRKIKLIENGLKETEIARALGVSQQAINNEMRGEYRSKRIRAAICEMTGTTEEKMFPEVYPTEEKKDV